MEQIKAFVWSRTILATPGRGSRECSGCKWINEEDELKGPCRLCMDHDFNIGYEMNETRKIENKSW